MRSFTFLPDDAVRVAALSEYVDRWVSDRLLHRPPEKTMTTATRVSPTLREPQLLGQTVVVIGGSSEVGLKTARRAGAEEADGVLTCRNPKRLQPVRVNLIAPGFVDAPLSATPLGDRRDLFDAELGLAQTRRNELLVLVQLYRALGGGWLP